jgi:3-oxoacyl-[acyl-carrier protein] reductase
MQPNSAGPSIWSTRLPKPTDALLTGRVAVVTGAANGIGAATALALAAYGADLAICDRDGQQLEEVAKAVGELGRQCVIGVLDVRDADAVSGWIGKVTTDSFPRIDVLVNNAGGSFVAPVIDVTPNGERALIAENFTSVTGMIRAVVPWMTSGGSIINVTSLEAFRACPNFGIYAAMKAAVENVSRTLALELADRTIRVNCVAPESIPTPGDAALNENSAVVAIPDISPHPWPETGSVHDCANAIVFLSGDLSRFVTGTTLHVDGGNGAALGWKSMPAGGFSI